MAFTFAKAANDGGGGGAQRNDKRQDHGSDYIEKCEFRLLLVYLRQYLELWQMFSEIDISGDRRVEFAEFQKAVPIIQSWGGKITDPAAEFKKVDKDGGGMILLGEIAEWALRLNLDLPDNDEFDDATLRK